MGNVFEFNGFGDNDIIMRIKLNVQFHALLITLTILKKKNLISSDRLSCSRT